MLTEFLSKKTSLRFLLVTFLPHLVFAALVTGLLAAGAPRRRPSWGALAHAVNGSTVIGATVVLGCIITASIALYPLNYAFVQLVEGYWPTISAPLIAVLREIGVTSEVRRRTELQRVILSASDDEAPSVREAREEIRWLPNYTSETMPTRLGNALRMGEIRAGRRYGMSTAAVWPRMVRRIPEDDRAQITDLRNQLDTSVRLCVISLLTVPITVALLLPYDIWLLVPFALFLFSWLCYRASIAAAKRFSLGLSVMFDLHHLAMWDTLSLQRPPTLLAERRRAAQLSEFLADEPLEDEELASFVYTAKASETDDNKPQHT